MQIHPKETNVSYQESQMLEVPSDDKLLKTKQTIRDRSAVNQLALQQYLKQIHPTNPEEELYDCGNCYGMDIGFNCCCQTDLHSDINSFGAGIAIYFRFLKQVILYFILFSFLTLPQLIFSITNIQDRTSLNSILLSTTLGSLSLTGDSCVKMSWEDVQNNDNITLQEASVLQKTSYTCSSGTISKTNFILGFYVSSSTMPCSYFDVTQAITNCTNDSAFQNIQTTCIGKTQCEFLITTDLFNSCSDLQSNLVYATAFCQDSEFSIFGLKVKYDTVALICGYTDLLIVLIVAIFLFTLEKQEKDTMKSVNETEVLIENFTLEFYNLPEISQANELYKKMMILEQQLQKKFPHIPNFYIVDIQFSQGNQQILMGQKRIVAIKKRTNLVKRFEAKYQINAVTSMDIKMNITNVVLTQQIDKISIEQKESAENAIKEIANLETTIIEYENILLEPQQQQSNEPIKYAWVTFETMEQRNMAYFLYQQDYLRDFFGCCGCSEILKLDENIIRATPAPSPDDINWMNLQHTTCEIYSRRMLSFILTLILITFTIAAIIFLKYEQLQYITNYPEPNCSMYTEVTEADVITDQSRTIKQGLLECYCKEDFINRINYTFSNGEQLCQQWFSDYLQIVGWPFLIVLVIIIINYIISFIFTKFSEFEAHRSKSKQLSSRLLKVFLIQFINTALVILIINIRFSNELNLSTFSVWLNGKFDDITVPWFNQVGITIILTMTIYIFNPIFNIFILSFISCLKKCFDSCCLDDGKFTRKLTQQDLNEYYSGIEFNVELKYSQILNVICVSFLYSSGMPILYLTTAFYLICSYFCHKYTLLHYCKIPEKIDDSIAKLINQILKLLLIWHIIFAIWIFGSNKLFPETINFTQDIENNTIVQSAKQNMLGEFFTRAFTSQCIGLFCMLILLILYYIMWPFLLKPILQTVFFFCFEESTLFEKVENTFISNNQSLYELYSTEQANEIIKIVRQERDDAQQNQNNELAILKGTRLAKLQAIKFFKGVINGLYSYDIVLNPRYASN